MEQLFLILLFIISGYLAVRFKLASREHYKPLANVVFYVCLPFSVLSSFVGFEIPKSLMLSIAILIASFIFSISASYAIYKIFSLDRKILYVLLLTGFFGNVIYFGFPFTETILGKGSIPLAGIYAGFYNLLVFGLLYPFIKMQAEGKQDGIQSFLKIAKNPVVLSAVGGLAILATNIDISSLLFIMEPFADLTTPLSLIAMGMFINGEIKIKFDRNLLAITASKCLIFPAITLGLLLVAGIASESKELFLLSLMPIAITNFVLVDSLGLKLDKLVMDSLIVTSILSTIIVIGISALGYF